MNELYCFKLKSHPKKLLFNHLKNVAELSKEIINSKVINLNKTELSNVSYIIGVAHDFGKSTTYFQEKINNNTRTEKANHALISALFGYYLLNNLFPNNDYPLIGYLVILRHHGYLKNFEDERKTLETNKELIETQIKDIEKYNKNEIKNIYLELLKPFNLNVTLIDIFINKLLNDYDKFKIDILRGIRNKLTTSNKLDNYFKTVFLYSVLLDSDKLDGCEYSKLPQKDSIIIKILNKSLVDTYKKSIESKNEINTLRNSAYEEALRKLEEIDLSKNRIMSINLPTGLGKTLIGLSTALRIKEKIYENMGFSPRIIYSLPFLSIIDQNSKVIQKVLKTKIEDIPTSLFMEHSHVSDISYREQKQDELENLDPAKSLILIESWHSEIVITTFMQLFHSLIANKNSALRKFHNITNSVIILDEIQNIPIKYWNLISEVLTYICYTFNCFVILMTATEPLIFEKDKIINLIDNKDKYFNNTNRYKIGYNGIIELNDFIDFILNEIENNDSNKIIILNTIKSCKEVYQRIKENLIKKSTKQEVINGCLNLKFKDKKKVMLINLSTLIFTKDRLQRIQKINLGKSRKIIVSTQLIEAGVDISSGQLFRDLAPIDSIIQSAGRCNRNKEQSKYGGVFLFKIKNKGNYFCNRIYDKTLIDITEEIINENKMNVNCLQENEFTRTSQDSYYQKVQERKAQDDLIKELKTLNFNEISKFELIHNEPSYDILIEHDKSISKSIGRIQLLINKLKSDKGNKFKILAKIKKEKRKLSKYTISIPCYKITDMWLNLNSLFNSETFKIIEKRDISNYYDKETGLKNDFEEDNIL